MSFPVYGTHPSVADAGDDDQSRVIS